jgi:hypothetical protein
MFKVSGHRHGLCIQASRAKRNSRQTVEFDCKTEVRIKMRGEVHITWDVWFISVNFLFIYLSTNSLIIIYKMSTNTKLKLIYLGAYVCIYKYTYMHTHIGTHINTRIYTHTYTHSTYIHTYITSSTNPWNAVYKLASNKAKRSETVSSLQKPDQSLTTDINEKSHILDYLNTKDEVDNDSDYHKTIRTLTEQPIETADNREFTPNKIANAIDAINCKKHQLKTGSLVTFQRAYKQFPDLINTLYNECLRQVCFPNKWKRVKVIPITKPGKADATNQSKFRPINLINVRRESAGKSIN